MVIRSAELRQTSAHEKLSIFSRTESLKITRPTKRFSPPNLISARNAERTAKRVEEEIEDLKFRLLKRLLEALTGRKVDVVTSIGPEGSGAPPVLETSMPQAPTGEAPTVEYSVSERAFESESLKFTSEGVVMTADSKEIRVDVELSMRREFYSETNLRFVNGQRVTDPLVVNFEGPAAALNGARFSFDLDADGDVEKVAALAPSSGYLALDKDGNGEVGDGSELFGPTSGDGFKELARHDSDGNGWIDEADPVFSRLRVWVGGSEGQKGSLLALLQVGVGAISLQNLRAGFDIKDSATNELLGSARSASVFLKEGGGAGTVQQIDLAV